MVLAAVEAADKGEAREAVLATCRVKVRVRAGAEWAVAVWDPAENVFAQIVARQFHIEEECLAMI
jgi:hypothetical protein